MAVPGGSFAKLSNVPAATTPATKSSTGPAPLPEVGELATELRTQMGRLKRLVRHHSREDLTPSQISALASLDGHGPLRLGELARVEAISPPSLTKIIGGLEQRGFVERTGDPTDRRSAVVDLTAAGRAALQAVRNERTAFLARRIATLTTAERNQLATAVGLLRQLTDLSDEDDA